jgi:hypothetical protein
MGYKAVTYQRNISPPSSGSLNEPNKKPANRACYFLNAGYYLAYSSILDMEIYIPPKRLLTINGLYGFISQKIELLVLLCKGKKGKAIPVTGREGP